MENTDRMRRICRNAVTGLVLLGVAGAACADSALQQEVLKFRRDIRAATQAAMANARNRGGGTPLATSDLLDHAGLLNPIPLPAEGPALAKELDAQNAQVDLEDQLKTKVLTACLGRIGALRTQQGRQISRSEWVSFGGGMAGVLGAVLKCPQCAAGMAALAGLANPLQQTFKDNGDTAADTQALLAALSTQINKDLLAWQALPPAIPGDASFWLTAAKRSDALFLTEADCELWNTVATNGAGVVLPAPAASPAAAPAP